MGGWGCGWKRGRARMRICNNKFLANIENNYNNYRYLIIKLKIEM